jgi:hypothetical protein
MNWVPSMRIDLLLRRNRVPVRRRHGEVDSQDLPITWRSREVVVACRVAMRRQVAVDNDDVPVTA